MRSGQSELACGCVLIFDDKKTFINDVDMSHMVSNVADIKKCQRCQAKWDEAARKWSEEYLDQIIEDYLFGKLETDPEN
jgi:hypothetical protein